MLMFGMEDKILDNIHFQILFFKSSKKLHFLKGQNLEESKLPGHFSSTFLNCFDSKIGVKLPSKKSSLTLTLGCAGQGVKLPFFFKMHFLGRKTHFFEKFILYKNVQ